MGSRILSLAGACMLALLSAAFGRQDASAAGPRAKGVKGEVAGVSFAVPDDFRLVKAKTGESFAFMRHKREELGLFVAVAPAAPAGFEQLVAALLDPAAAKLFPKDQQKFEWKATGNLQTISKHESGGGGALGFNQRVAVLADFHRISFNGRELLVGYVTEFGKGRQAAETFARGLGGGSGEGCVAVVELASSITREKIDEDHHPCGLRTLPGSVE